MMKFILFISLLISIIFDANASNSYGTKEVSKFIDYMANKHGYKKNDLRNLFNKIEEEKKLKKFFKKAPERRLTWNGCEQNEKQCINYKSLFVTDHNIKNGWQEPKAWSFKSGHRLVFIGICPHPDTKQYRLPKENAL